MTASQKDNNHTKNLASYLFSLSIFSLAGALVYFSWTIVTVSQHIPIIIESVNETSLKIEPALIQIGEIKDLVQPALNEVTEIRKQIPLMLEEVKRVREQLPAILITADKASNAIELVSQEVKATRPLVPQILEEVNATRKAIPPLLDRADKLVLNIRVAGKEASKGAVSGLFTGIIAAPFDMVGALGKKVIGLSSTETKELTEADLVYIEKTANEVLASAEVNETKSWENDENKTNGTVTLINVDESKDQLCKNLNIKNWKSKKSLTDKDIKVCQNEDGTWELVK